MLFTMLAMVGSFVGGGVVGAGGLKAFGALIEAKAKADVSAVVADVKAELAKVSPDLTTLKTKIQSLLTTLGL